MIEPDKTNFMKLNAQVAALACIGILMLFQNVTLAQQYVYGVTAQSTNGQMGGNIYRFDPQSKTAQTLTSFPIENEGSYPMSSMIKHSNGFYYGTTGDYAGLIYKYDLVNEVYTVVHQFEEEDYTNGWGVSGGVIEGSDGKLYGMTTYGGTDEHGLIYSYDLTQNQFTVLHEFNSNNIEGEYPKGKLLEFEPGIFYGMSEYGGANNLGQLFRYELVNDTYTGLVDFTGSTGNRPTGTLQKRDFVNIIGTTRAGGNFNNGVLFEYNTIQDSYLKIFNFNNFSTGNMPNDPLITESGGIQTIYGTTERGGSNNDGVLYKFTLGQYSVIHNFDEDNTLGSHPAGALLLSADGKLYGTTTRAYDGLSSYDGNIFRLDPVSGAVSNLYSFHSKNGKEPMSGLLEISNGVFLGNTLLGGASGLGTIFQYHVNQNELLKLSDFSLAPAGFFPQGGLTTNFTPNGLFYGVATFGGPEENAGVIYSFDPTNNSIELVHPFTYEQGAFPLTGLALSSDSVLYGVTSEGGNLSGNLALGTLYSYDLKAKTYTQLHNLPLSNGEKSKVVLHNNKLFGTMMTGGQFSSGLLYQYDLSSGVFTELYEFNSQGTLPYGHPIVGSDGKLYGVTRTGGASNSGVIYSFNLTSSIYTVEHNFAVGLLGGNPAGTLVEGVNGTFYGTTINGGDDAGGILFRFTTSPNNLVVLKEFANGVGPYSPFGELVLVNDVLFGQTQSRSGVSEVGSVFSYNLTGGAFSLITSFPGDVPNAALAAYCLYPTYNVVGGNDVNLCPGDDLAISINTPNTDSYVWEKDNVVVSGQNSSTFFSSAIDPVGSGIYSFQLTNACGTIDDDVDVFVSDIVPTINKTDIKCFGDDSGILSITASGGVPIYKFSLDGVNFRTTDFGQLSSGAYNITVKDGNECIVEVATTLNELATAPVTVNAVFDGLEVTLAASGGTAPYTYSSDGTNFQTDNVFLLPNGQYTFTTKDAYDCEISTTQALVITGLDEKQGQRVLAYPNPAVSAVHLQGLLKGSPVRLMSISGQTMIEEISAGNQHTISVELMVPGMYVLEAIDDHGTMNRYKLIKK